MHRKSTKKLFPCGTSWLSPAQPEHAMHRLSVFETELFLDYTPLSLF